jgi:hypothetical protein
MEKIVEVDQFTGPCYSEGIIVFYRNGETVPFGKKEKKSYVYHIDMEDIDELALQYPEYIPSFNKKIYKSRTTWGYDVEKGLCKLMIENKLSLYRDYQGERIKISYRWVGPEWNPLTRPTRRN